VLAAGHLLRKLLSLNLIGASVFLLLVAIGKAGGGEAARLDPVPQAMVLTGLIVAVSSTAFALSLMLALYRRSGRADLDEPVEVVTPAGREVGGGG
jgi:multicomponent Na+:H+ antiporter subunit C